MPERWLEAPVTVTTAVAVTGYTWFDASRFVPSDAVALVLTADCVKSAATSSVLAVRATPRLTDVNVFDMNIAQAASVPRVVLALDGAAPRPAFQWRITGNTFGTSLTLSLTGYVL